MSNLKRASIICSFLFGNITGLEGNTNLINCTKDVVMINTDNKNGFGIERLGRLKRVLLHRPEEAIKLINEDNREFFLFDKVPDADRYLEEHKRYQELLSSHGVEVVLLKNKITANIDLMNRLPNLAYMHDIAVVSSNGAIVSKMSSRGRCHEEIVIGEALKNMGIPVLYEPPEGEDFEGCLLLSPTTVFIADTERHKPRSIEKFIEYILDYFDEVIYARVPQERRYMHPDMVLNRIREDLLIYFPPAFLKTLYITKAVKEEINIKAFMKSRNIDMIEMSEDEQKKWGSSFVPLDSGIIINYDISLKQKTINILESEGVKFIHFHPDALLAGGGSLRCLTLRIWRNS
ncbi:MAG: arginine deiminase family protein [Bacillota bacterium]|nr:arginine deiminase family protein [Bacillota bacterium]